MHSVNRIQFTGFTYVIQIFLARLFFSIFLPKLEKFFIEGFRLLSQSKQDYAIISYIRFLPQLSHFTVLEKYTVH